MKLSADRSVLEPVGMISMKRMCQGRSRVMAAKSAISSSFESRISTTLSLMGWKPTASAASSPRSTLSRVPGRRAMVSARSARSESSEMLTRSTPAAFSSSAWSSSSTALVERAMFSMPSMAESMRMRDARSRRTSGSPPVMRSRLSPIFAITRTTRAISS